MSFQTCPTDIVSAAAERAWEFLIQPSRIATWVDAKLLSGPSRPLEVGDRLVLGVGLWCQAKVVMDVLAQQKPQMLELHVQLPLGLVNHEIIQLREISPSKCRITFN